MAASTVITGGRATNPGAGTTISSGSPAEDDTYRVRCIVSCNIDCEIRFDAIGQSSFLQCSGRVLHVLDLGQHVLVTSDVLSVVYLVPASSADIQAWIVLER